MFASSNFSKISRFFTIVQMNLIYQEILSKKDEASAQGGLV